MNKVLSAVATAFLLLFAFAAGVSAHTGGVNGVVQCDGYHIEVTLNSDVAESSTWTLTVGETTVANGTGPGPQSLNFQGPWNGGNAYLTILFNGESNVYEAELSAPDCATPTPEPSSSLVPPETSPPRPTVPPSDTETGAVGPMGPQGDVPPPPDNGKLYAALFILGGALVVIFAAGLPERRR